MFRNLAVAVFLIPKLVVWPLIWYWRCRRNKECSKNDTVLQATTDQKVPVK
ncbi:MAG: hypothetical protein SCK29_07385 [Bacillota bacterium]|nr:hypothetical protein [Bacillota bacterium]MDW7683922.1 hypothetical protein [Bacillota bacterium]